MRTAGMFDSTVYLHARRAQAYRAERACCPTSRQFGERKRKCEQSRRCAKSAPA